MTKKIWVGAGVLLVLAMITVAGKALNLNPWSIDKNPDFARQLLDSVYAGSLSSVHNSLAPPLPGSMPDSITAGTSAVLGQAFGRVKDLELQSSTTFQSHFPETVWTVIAEHGSFEMKLRFHSGKLIAIWFKRSSVQEWSPANELGAAYVKRQRGSRGKNPD